MNENKFCSNITRQPQYKPHNTHTRWSHQKAHNTSFSLILLIGQPLGFWRKKIVLFHVSKLRVCLDWVYFCWNWKHYSKIIFKCVNSVVGPIFNKKVAEKCNLWDCEQCTDAMFTVDKVIYCRLNKKKKKKKKKKKEKKTQCQNVDARIIAIQTGTYS